MVHISSRSCGPGFSSATVFKPKGEVQRDVEPRRSPRRANRRIGFGSRSVSACSRRLPIGRSALCLEKSASAGVEPRCYCAASAAAFSVEGLQPLG